MCNLWSETFRKKENELYDIHRREAQHKERKNKKCPHAYGWRKWTKSVAVCFRRADAKEYGKVFEHTLTVTEVQWVQRCTWNRVATLSSSKGKRWTSSQDAYQKEQDWERKILQQNWIENQSQKRKEYEWVDQEGIENKCCSKLVKSRRCSILVCWFAWNRNIFKWKTSKLGFCSNHQ